MFDLRTPRLFILVLAMFLLLGGAASSARAQEYTRPVDVVPTEEDIGEGYQMPAVQCTPPRPSWWGYVDIALLAMALMLAAWIVFARLR